MTTSLTIGDLFTPAPSGVGNSPNLPPPTGSWLATLLSIATTVQLPTTSWQPGAPERSILAIAAVVCSMQDAIISKIAQGGFLQFAAAGTVTYVGIDGTSTTLYVTPDPSVPSQNPTGALGWLDALGSSEFDEDRLLATRASGEWLAVNTGAGSAGPFDPGTYHVANTTTKATYANTATLTIPPSIVGGTAGEIVAVAVGSVTTLTTNNPHGISSGDFLFVNGVVGVAGINGFFARVIAASGVTIQLQLATTGSYVSGGRIYKCTVGLFQADLTGTVGNAGPGSVTTTVTKNTGVGGTNLTAWSASNFESNSAYASRCQLKLGTLSPNGPSQAYAFLALSAQKLLGAQAPPILLTNGPIVQAIAAGDPVTGDVITTIASASPASSTLGDAVTPGCSQLAITGATNATPIVITTSGAHNMVDGFVATVSGVLGNTAANGTFAITRLSTTTFSLNGSVGSGAYTANTGSVEGGDLGQVDALLQRKAVPDGIVAITRSALALPVTVVATVVVPASFVTAYTAAIAAALQAYLSTVPIGGVVLPGAGVGVVPLSGIEGALDSIGVVTVGTPSYVIAIEPLTINGVAADLTFLSDQYQAILATPTVSVVGV